MNIPKLFNATWDQVYKGAVAYGDSDILPDLHVIIVNRNVKRLIWGELIMLFTDSGEMALITSRYCVPQLAAPAYVHTLLQAKRLRKLGIVSNVAFEKGLVTCTYSKAGWLEHVVQDCSSARSQQPT